MPDSITKSRNEPGDSSSLKFRKLFASHRTQRAASPTSSKAATLSFFLACGVRTIRPAKLSSHQSIKSLQLVGNTIRSSGEPPPLIICDSSCWMRNPDAFASVSATSARSSASEANWTHSSSNRLLYKLLLEKTNLFLRRS
jgi:hypothetical protein